jgi:hypothetical protein
VLEYGEKAKDEMAGIWIEPVKMGVIELLDRSSTCLATWGTAGFWTANGEHLGVGTNWTGHLGNIGQRGHMSQACVDGNRLDSARGMAPSPPGPEVRTYYSTSRLSPNSLPHSSPRISYPGFHHPSTSFSSLFSTTCP